MHRTTRNHCSTGDQSGWGAGEVRLDVAGETEAGLGGSTCKFSCSGANEKDRTWPCREQGSREMFWFGLFFFFDVGDAEYEPTQQRGVTEGHEYV